MFLYPFSGYINFVNIIHFSATLTPPETTVILSFSDEKLFIFFGTNEAFDLLCSLYSFGLKALGAKTQNISLVFGLLDLSVLFVYMSLYFKLITFI